MNLLNNILASADDQRDDPSLFTTKKSKVELIEHDPDSDWIEYHVSSENRTNSNHPTHNFSNKFFHRNSYVDAVVLEHVVIPPLYNIDANNNTITFDEGAGALVATITPGGYAVGVGTVTFEAAITAALNAAGTDTYTVAYNDNTYKLTITNTTGTNTFDWTANSQLATMLGFASTDSTSLAASHTGSNILDISIDELFIDIQELGTAQRANTVGTLHYTFKLVLNSITFGTKNTLYRKEHIPNCYKVYDNPIELSHLSIRILDKYGQIKDLQGGHISLTFKFRAFINKN